jgi:hypothetical protein
MHGKYDKVAYPGRLSGVLPARIRTARPMESSADDAAFRYPSS